MIRFIHTADWHIRDTQYGRGFRGDDFRRSARQILDYAVDYKVDFIVNGGDTLDRNRPSGDMLDFLFEVDTRLKAAGIPMYTVTGNHDDSEPSFLTFPGYDRKDAAGGVVCIDHQVVEHAGVRIAGFPACPWGEVEEKVSKMKTPPDILVWHGAVMEYMPFGCELSLERVWETRFKAALLGDLHIHESCRGGAEEERILAYPGSIEMAKRNEGAEKFFDVYELQDDWRSRSFPNPIAVPLETRPVLFLRADSEERASDCVAKVRALADLAPEKIPMIFMSYNWEYQDVVSRVMSSIDRTKTIFRWKGLSATFGGMVYESEERAQGMEAVRPKLMEVVSKVMPPNSNLHKLTKLLADPETNARSVLMEYVDGRLNEGDQTTATATK